MFNSYQVEEEADEALHDYHVFVTTAEVDDDLQIIVYYAGRADLISHQYHVVAKFQFANKDDAISFMKGENAHNCRCLRTLEPTTLPISTS